MCIELCQGNLNKINKHEHMGLRLELQDNKISMNRYMNTFVLVLSKVY